MLHNLEAKQPHPEHIEIAMHMADEILNKPVYIQSEIMALIERRLREEAVNKVANAEKNLAIAKEELGMINNIFNVSMPLKSY